MRPFELERFPVGRAISEILWRKKKKKKETSAVKYNTSGHYRGRRYKNSQVFAFGMFTFLTYLSVWLLPFYMAHSE